MNCNGVIVLKVLILPDQFENILRAEYPPRLAGQQEQNAELYGGQLNRTVVYFDGVGLLINLQRAKLNQMISGRQRRLGTVESSS
ncbi:hypothetical protein D3C87_1842850 [compost metagenome]